MKEFSETPQSARQSGLPESFDLLKSRLKDVSKLKAVSSLLYWDQATYLPEGAAEERGEQLAWMERLAHEMATSDQVGQWLDDLASVEKGLPTESDEACFIRVARRDYERDLKVPSDFFAEFSSHASRSYEEWKRARASNDFKLVSDSLKKTVELSQKLAEYLKAPGHLSIMDPLIDLSDPGFTVENLNPLFSSLRERLVPLLKNLSSIPPFDTSCLRQSFPEQDQIAFGENLIRQFGYEFSRGRQDKTAHPFMIRLGKNDVRITTRVKERDLSEALFSTIHEAGHALYELGIHPSLAGTPLGQGASSGLHESQSRLWENQIGRSLPFWEYAYPLLQSEFPQQLGNVPLDSFYRAINWVEPSLIRTDADEVTYNLHVMIRFDLERDLLEGRLRVDDLPDAWAERYKADLGVTPTTVSDGVLQDVHWFHGSVGGAFQGYAIGNILSGQIFAAAHRALPGLNDQIRKGEFYPLRAWLQKELHQYGRKFESSDLIQRVTGRPLGTEDYIRGLERKYSAFLE